MWLCTACGDNNHNDALRCTCGCECPDSSDIPVEMPTPWRSVTLTTAPYLEGYRVDETVEIITAECAYGMNIFSDLFTSLTDKFGGRSLTIQGTLRNARRVCLEELRREAHSIGADAVIAVDLDYSEFSGQGKSMLFLVASGTAVKVSPCPPPAR
jgi:uncharacterized protein YbjQ (UPF0145 family)